MTAASEASGGLVHLSTRATAVPLDAGKSRNRRKKCGTITAARLLQEQMQEGGFRYKVAMVTLTYALVDSWRPQHVRAFLRICREYLRRRGVDFRYTWVAELQKRGAVHYHILIWLPKGLTLPKPDKRRWWVFGSTSIEWTRNAVGYIAKYAGKEDDISRFPKGLRICGTGGLDKKRRMERRWWLSPAWVRREFAISDDVRRAKGGGYVSESGERVYSPFFVGYVDGSLCLLRKPPDYDDEAIMREWRQHQLQARAALHESTKPDYIDGYRPTPEQRLGPDGVEASRKRFVDFITERLGPLRKYSDTDGITPSRPAQS